MQGTGFHFLWGGGVGRGKVCYCFETFITVFQASHNTPNLPPSPPKNGVELNETL